MRRTLWLLVILGLVVGTPSATAASSDCERYRTTAVPLLHPSLDVGYAERCDEDGDGTTDTVAFQTEHVSNNGYVSLTHEEKQRSSHQDAETTLEARLTPDTPVKTITYQRVEAQDDGNDGQIDRIDGEGILHTGAGSASYLATLFDDDANHVPDAYGLLVCSSATGCEAPGPNTLPEVPDRIDLPDTVVYIPGVGYVP